MENLEAWEIMARELARGTRFVSCRWVFKIKADGRYRGHFTNSYGPVVRDIGLRILLAIVIKVRGYIAEKMDVDTAFLFRNLEEEIIWKFFQGTTSRLGPAFVWRNAYMTLYMPVGSGTRT